MNDYLEIESRVKVLFNSLKNNDFTNLKDVLSIECKCYSSTNGNGEGIKETCNCLSWKDKDGEMLKQDITNLVIRNNKKEAIVTAHEIVLRGIVTNDNLYSFQYAGTYLIRMHKLKNWEIYEIRYDLTIVKGNTYWARNWNLIDYGRHFGHEPMINYVYDSPWTEIETIDRVMSDEELITEKVYQYGWVIDEEDYPLFRKITTDDFWIYDGYHDKKFNSGREWVDFLRYLNYREPCLHHSYKVVKIEITGDEAKAYVKRVEPDRIGKYSITKENYKLNWFTLNYVFSLVRKKKDWLLKKVEFNTAYTTSCSNELSL